MAKQIATQIIINNTKFTAHEIESMSAFELLTIASAIMQAKESNLNRIQKFIYGV